MAKKPDESRLPSAVGSIPVFGEFMKNADAQARWMQDLLEQNARLIGQLPDTIKAFNDSLERFNQSVARLDRATSRMESAGKRLTGPIERILRSLDRKSVREMPDTLDVLRKEAVPALRAAADAQKTMASLQSTLDRVISAVGAVPGAAMVRRLAKPRDEQPPTSGRRTSRPAADPQVEHDAEPEVPSSPRRGSSTSSTARPRRSTPTTPG